MDKVYAVVKSRPGTKENIEYVSVICSTYDRALQYIKEDLGYILVPSCDEVRNIYWVDPDSLRLWPKQAWHGYELMHKPRAFIVDFKYYE